MNSSNYECAVSMYWYMQASQNSYTQLKINDGVCYSFGYFTDSNYN